MLIELFSVGLFWSFLGYYTLKSGEYQKMAEQIKRNILTRQMFKRKFNKYVKILKPILRAD